MELILPMAFQNICESWEGASLPMLDIYRSLRADIVCLPPPVFIADTLQHCFHNLSELRLLANTAAKALSSRN